VGDPAQFVAGRDALQRLPPLVDHRADTLRIVDQGQAMQHVWRDLEHGRPGALLAAHHFPRERVDQQRRADHQRLDAHVAPNGLGHEAHAFDVVQARARPLGTQVQVADTLDGQIVAALDGPRAVGRVGQRCHVL